MQIVGCEVGAPSHDVTLHPVDMPLMLKKEPCHQSSECMWTALRPAHGSKPVAGLVTVTSAPWLITMQDYRAAFLAACQGWPWSL
jgi:hypothetical protein